MKESIRWDGAERVESQEVGNRTQRERFDISRRIFSSSGCRTRPARPWTFETAVERQSSRSSAMEKHVAFRGASNKEPQITDLS